PAHWKGEVTAPGPRRWAGGLERPERGCRGPGNGLRDRRYWRLRVPKRGSARHRANEGAAGVPTEYSAKLQSVPNGSGLAGNGRQNAAFQRNRRCARVAAAASILAFATSSGRSHEPAVFLSRRHPWPALGRGGEGAVAGPAA